MIQIIIMIVSLLMCLCICVWGSKRNNNVYYETQGVMSRKTSTTLKGVAIWAVFIHHYGQLSNEYYNTHTFIGYLGVTIFLFIAGYASQRQLIIKGKEYLSFSFLLKKFIRLYIPFIFANIILGMLRQGSIHSILASIVHIKDDWFLVAISVLYLIFFSISRFCCKLAPKFVFMIIAMLILFYIIICRLCNLPFVWYNTSFSFLIGIIFCQYEDKIVQITNSKIVIASVSFMSAFFCWLTASRLFLPEISSSLLAIFFSFFMILIVSKYTISDKFMTLFGTISWEFYLVQSKVLTLTKDWADGNYLFYFVVSITLSFVLAFAINRLMFIITNKIVKKVIIKRDVFHRNEETN